ncbi:LysR family transcriptional regulator [Pseudomonadota bacterium]
MIDYLRHMAIFVRVIDCGSFRAAAKSLGLAPSRISETISDLESYLGVTLLYRTTRKMALTNEGSKFYSRIVEMLNIAETGVDELNMHSVEPTGNLSISLPAFMAASSISTALAEFLRQYPKIKLTVSYSDLPVELIDTGFDLNIRIGWLSDSSMMSRKLSEEARVIVAGKEYVTSRPTPITPKDLESWNWIKYQQRSECIELSSKDGASVKIKGQYQLKVDSIEALFNFTCQNLGVTVLPWHIAERGLLSGALVQLLPDWHLEPLGCFAVWADTSRRESLTLMLVRFLAEREKSILELI